MKNFPIGVLCVGISAMSSRNTGMEYTLQLLWSSRICVPRGRCRLGLVREVDVDAEEVEEEVEAVVAEEGMHRRMVMERIARKPRKQKETTWRWLQQNTIERGDLSRARGM